MTKIEKQKIGYRIKQARIAKNLSIPEIAEKLNVTPGYIYKIESGNSGYSFQVLSNFARILNVSVPDFFKWENEGVNDRIKDVESEYLTIAKFEERIMQKLNDILGQQQVTIPQPAREKKLNEIVELIKQLPADHQFVIINKLVGERFKKEN